jgi:hypothetical protein
MRVVGAADGQIAFLELVGEGERLSQIHGCPTSRQARPILAPWRGGRLSRFVLLNADNPDDRIHHVGGSALTDG